MHAAVEAAFPPSAACQDKAGRVLWRLDSMSDSVDGLWLYIASPEKPDLTHLAEQAGWPAVYEGLWETKEYSALLDRIANGQRWGFRLKANPVRKAKVDKGRRQRDGVVGTIQGHVTVGQQIEWLVSRAQAHGFMVDANDDGEPLVVVGQRNREVFRRGDATVTLVTAVFDGALVVTDADKLRSALCWGIGRAKGFGCGLLTLAPVHED